MRVLVVMNPSACDFEAQKRWPSLEPLLAQRAAVTLLKTDPDNDVTIASVTRALAQDFDRVVAIGGDGTVHLTVSAIMRAGLKTLPQFGVIPFGTANNVAKCLGLPLDDHPAQARVAVGEKLRGLDVASLTVRGPGGERKHFWTNCVSVGMDADIVAARSQYRKMGKYLSYAAALAERTLEQRSMDVRVTVDGQVHTERVFNLIVMNVPLYAGALNMPGARMDDQTLDLYLFDRNEYSSKVLSYAIKQVDLLNVGVGDFLEEITRNQRALHGRSLTLRLAYPRAIQVDGEGMGEAEELEMATVAQLQAACA